MARSKKALLFALLSVLVGVVVVVPVLLRSKTVDEPSATPTPGPTPTATPTPEPTPPSPPVTPTPTPTPTLPVRDGLIFSGDELGIWRTRAERGPYKSPGDVSRNSPGDWDRIVEEANTFLEDPVSSMWEGPTRLNNRGCVKHVSGPNNNNNPPLGPPSRLRDAAFYYLITDDERMRDAVHQVLLEQANVSLVDFSDSARFCLGAMEDGSPGFDLANWLTKLLYAYDFLGPDSFTPEERETLNSWFYEAANFFARDIDRHVSRLFVDRADGDYRLTELASNAGPPRVGYYGGKPTYPIHRFYNNRGATRVRFVAAAAIKLVQENHQAPAGDDKLTVPELQDAAKTYVREWVTYSVFEEGFFGEFERWSPAEPDLGWAYAGDVLAPVLSIADLFARAGDTELYDFTTVDGALGTEGTEPRGLLFAAQALARYGDGTYERYGTADSGPAGDADYMIDGRSTRKNGNEWIGLHDMQVVLANLYYRDPYLTETYLRTSPRQSYPEKPSHMGQHSAWHGDWGTRPGMLFMYGGLEGEVWPYGVQAASR